MVRRGRWIGAFLAALLLFPIGGVAYADDGNGGDRFTARLSGDQEVPPADPDGTARAKFRIDVDGGQLCFDIRIRKTGTPNRGHIHVGPSGVNGGIVAPLFELAGAPTDPRNDEIEKGRIRDCVAADPAVLAAIVADPAGYYVNLHNSRFPAGAVRGQLRPEDDDD